MLLYKKHKVLSIYLHVPADFSKPYTAKELGFTFLKLYPYYGIIFETKDGYFYYDTKGSYAINEHTIRRYTHVVTRRFGKALTSVGVIELPWYDKINRKDMSYITEGELFIFLLSNTTIHFQGDFYGT